ncbi:MAG: DUF2852 domain-containing protein [Pseudomonadota bacterium]
MSAVAVDNCYDAGPTGRGNGRGCRKGGWSALEIVVLVLLFVFVWPLGLAFLAYLLCRAKEDRRMDRQRMREFVSNMTPANWGRESNGWGGGSGGSHGGWGGRGPRPTGNLAFDEYRQAELDRLEAERRRLIEEEREFDTFLKHLRMAKDREEFDRFMRERATRPDDQDGDADPRST